MMSNLALDQDVNLDKVTKIRKSTCDHEWGLNLDKVTKIRKSTCIQYITSARVGSRVCCCCRILNIIYFYTCKYGRV